MRGDNNTVSQQIILCFMLTLMNFVNYFDRSLVGIMAEDIKRDIGLSDGELGLSTSVAFGVTYSLLALPIARLADGGWRKTVMIGSIAIWSSMTLLVGSVRNFWQLAACRVGVALGEAGILPASLSMVSTEFRSARSGLIISILWAGSILGAASAPLVGGWMSGLVGWRTTFMLVGAASLLLLPMALLVLPGQQTQDREKRARSGASPRTEPWIRGLLKLFGQRTYLFLWGGTALMFAAPAALNLYAGPFLIRTFDLSPVSAGAHLGITFGPPMICGTLFGGWLFDRLRQRSLSLALVVPGIGVVLGGLASAFAMSSASALMAAACLGVANTFFGLMAAPGYATAQFLAPVNLKSTAAATFNLGTSLVGGSVGPLLAGYLSDALAPSVGNRSLGYGLTAAAGVTIIGGAGVIIAAISALNDARGAKPAPA